MAGIKEAMRRVLEKKHRGTILAIGSFVHKKSNYDHRLYKFMILRLRHDEGFITVYEYEGGDISFEEGLKIDDHVMLEITSNYSAMWKNERGHVEPISKPEPPKGRVGV